MVDPSIKDRLQIQLAELTARQARVEGFLAEPLNADSSEQAVEVEDDAALAGQASLIDREIASVSRALERIAQGTYGACARCGTKIAAARLEVRPEAGLCIVCASDQQ